MWCPDIETAMWRVRLLLWLVICSYALPASLMTRPLQNKMNLIPRPVQNFIHVRSAARHVDRSRGVIFCILSKKKCQNAVPPAQTQTVGSSLVSTTLLYRHPSTGNCTTRRSIVSIPPYLEKAWPWASVKIIHRHIRNRKFKIEIEN